MAEIAGPVVGLISLCMKAFSALSQFVEAVNDAPSEIKALAKEVNGFQLLLRWLDSTAFENALLDDTTIDILQQTISEGQDILSKLNTVVQKVSKTIDLRGKTRKARPFKWAV